MQNGAHNQAPEKMPVEVWVIGPGTTPWNQKTLYYPVRSQLVVRRRSASTWNVTYIFLALRKLGVRSQKFAWYSAWSEKPYIQEPGLRLLNIGLHTRRKGGDYSRTGLFDVHASRVEPILLISRAALLFLLGRSKPTNQRTIAYCTKTVRTLEERHGKEMV